jgi:MFS family permease
MTFSRWLGPVVGVLVGLLAGIVTGLKDRSLGFWEPLMLGGGVGLAGGFLIMLVDPKAAKELPELEQDIDPTTLPNLSGNILCALGLLCFFMPFFGPFLSGFAIVLNWRVKGWARRLSWFGLLLGLLVTSLIVWHWLTPQTDN